MKYVAILVLGLALALPSDATAASIVGTSWNKGNLDRLNTIGKADVAQLLTDVTGFVLHSDCACVKPQDIGEFTWADLRGNGRLELLATLDVNGREFFNTVVIVRQEPSDKMTAEELEGWMITDLHSIIRDLNGNGQDELIIPTVLESFSTADTITWPAVYRLEKGKYVEASGDFPAYYDSHVLPQLDREIQSVQNERSAGGDGATEDKLASLIMTRDKILRVLGREPMAGLQQAHEWMNSNDPKLLLAAAATLKDIGGHEAESRAAGAAYRRALCGRHPDMAICK